jgi:hypothetical protein
MTTVLHTARHLAEDGLEWWRRTNVMRHGHFEFCRMDNVCLRRTRVVITLPHSMVATYRMTRLRVL